MKRKIICGVVAFLCFLWIIGLVDALEFDRMGFAEVVARGVPALAILYGSFWVGGFNR